MEEVIQALIIGDYNTATYLLDRIGAPYVIHVDLPRKRWSTEENKTYDLFEYNLSRSIASKGMINFHASPATGEYTITFLYNGYTFKVVGKT